MHQLVDEAEPLTKFNAGKMKWFLDSIEINALISRRSRQEVFLNKKVNGVVESRNRFWLALSDSIPSVANVISQAFAKLVEGIASCGDTEFGTTVVKLHDGAEQRFLITCRTENNLGFAFLVTRISSRSYSNIVSNSYLLLIVKGMIAFESVAPTEEGPIAAAMLSRQ